MRKVGISTDLLNLNALINMGNLPAQHCIGGLRTNLPPLNRILTGKAMLNPNCYIALIYANANTH